MLQPYLPPSIREIFSFPLQSDLDEEDLSSTSVDSSAETRDAQLGVAQLGISGEDFIPLCRRFLQTVHIRNPVLEEKDLMQYASNIQENGLQWDKYSCVVVSQLVACAYTPSVEVQTSESERRKE